VFLLILDSLGSIELLFIAIMALVFFGPRKLPQISRTIGKNLAEFRRASEDFKRTWEREVALEEFKRDPYTEPQVAGDDSMISNSYELEESPAPKPDAVSGEEAVAQSSMSETIEPPAVAQSSMSDTIEPPALAGETSETISNTTQPDPLRKQEWL